MSGPLIATNMNAGRNTPTVATKNAHLPLYDNGSCRNFDSS